MKDDLNSAWIDDVIKQHKKQLEELKRGKEQKGDLTYPDTNPFLPQTPKESIASILPVSKPPLSSISKPTLQCPPDQNKLQSKINEMTIKFTQKKEKISTLKQHNQSLIEENEDLKAQLSQMMIKMSTATQISESYDTTVSQLHQRIKELETELVESEMKLSQMTSIKEQEFDLMNQKIRDFEVIIDDNSSNYISNMNKLNKTIEEYKLRIIESDKYVNVVNFFIQKIDSLYGIEQKEIYDCKELQGKFVEIEKILMRNNLQCENNKEEKASIKPLPHFQNKVLKSISGMNEKLNKEMDGIGMSVGMGYEDSKLQEEDLDDGVDAEKTSIVYRTLEERVNELENEMRRNPLISKRQKKKLSSNNSNSLIVNSQKEAKGRSKSSTKISHEGINTNKRTEVYSAHKKIKKKKKPKGGNIPEKKGKGKCD